MAVHDKGQILLEDGIGMSLPTPLVGSYNFSYMPFGKTLSTVALSSPYYSMTMRAQEVVDSGDGPSLTASGKDFVPLHIYKENLIDQPNKFFKINVENIEREIADQFHESLDSIDLFDQENYIQIQGTSDIPELIPNTKTSHFVMTGICQNFRFVKAARSVGLVTVRSQTINNVETYIKKGHGEFASSTNFDFKSNSILSDVITVEGSSKNVSSTIKEEYSVAICSDTNTMFDILLNVDTKDPIVTLPAGEIFKKVIEKGKSFLVHFVSTRDDTLTLNIDGETSRASVYMTQVDSVLDLMELDKIAPQEDVEKLALTTNSPGIPSSTVIKVDCKARMVHYLFRIIPLDTDMITFYVMSAKQSVQIALRQNEKLQERLIAGETRKYVLRTSELEDSLQLSVMLDYGSLAIKYVTDGKESASGSLTLDAAQEKSKTLTIKAKDAEFESLGGLFKVAYVEVKAITNCLYDLVFEPPKGFYKALFPGSRIQVNNTKEFDPPHYFYNIKNLKGIRSFKVFVILDKKIDDTQDDSQMVTDSGFKDLVLSHFNFHFINSEIFGGKVDAETGKIVADIKKIYLTGLPSRKTVELEFAVQQGTFLISYQNRQDLQHMDISFELSLNNYLTVRANSYFVRYVEPGKSSEFQIHVPSKGQLYVDVEDCSGLIQVYGSANIDETKGPVSKRNELVDKVFMFDGPGFLYVTVDQKRKDPTASAIPFILRSEFIDDSRPKLLSSYFREMGSKGQLSPSRVNLSTDTNSHIIATVNGPLVSHQEIEKDYPDIMTICVATYIMASVSDNKANKVGDIKRKNCGRLDFQVLKSATQLMKEQNFTTFNDSQACIYRQENGNFDFSLLSDNVQTVLTYPKALVDEPNQPVTVSVLLSYFLGGRQVYDDYDDYEHVLAYTAELGYVNPASAVPKNPDQEITVEQPREEEQARNSFMIKISIGLICAFAILIGVYICRRCLLVYRQGQAFTRATRHTIEEPSQTSDQGESSSPGKLEITGTGDDI